MSSRLAVTVEGDAVPEPFGVTWNETLNRVGSFSFSALNTDAVTGTIEIGDLVTITKDSLDVFYGIVESIRQVDADDGEVAYTEFSGRSSLAELERVAVFPPLWPADGVGQTAGRDVSVQPWDRMRLFGWPDPTMATQLLGTAGGADDVTAITASRPDGFPDPQPYWVGDSGGASDVYFAAAISAGDADGSRYDIFAAFGGAAELYFQGVLVLSVTAAEADQSKTHHVQVPVTPGVPQVFTARVRTAGTLATNALLAVTVHDPDSYDPKFFFKTSSAVGQTWGMFADPATPPGCTPGELVTQIFTEWAARNPTDSLGWSLNFNGTQDSLGAEWPTIPIFPCQVGDSLLDVLDRLAEAWVDFAVDVDSGGRTLSMWVAPGVDAPDGPGTGRGVSKPVEIEVGVNALEVRHEVTA